MKKQIFNFELREMCPVSEAALAVLKKVKGMVSDELYQVFNESLLGFRKSIQLVIAEAFRDAVCNEWENYTNIINIDLMLQSIYMMIDDELGRN